MYERQVIFQIYKLQAAIITSLSQLFELRFYKLITGKN